MKNFKRWTFYFVTTSVLICSTLAWGQQTGILFQLGKFDRSSDEFASGTPRNPVVVKIGQGDVAKQWYGTQAAIPSGQQTSEGISSARIIEFPVDGPLAGAYRLHIALLIESAGVPSLEVAVNDKRGTFYLHPHLDFTVGDQTDPPDYSHADIDITFPGGYLHQGTNTIALQPTEVLEPGQSSATGSLTYDAIELEKSQGGQSLKPSAELFPTIFYQNKDGSLQETLEVYIQSSNGISAGSGVDLNIAGKHYHQDIAATEDFGERKVEFDVPEFSQKTLVEISWTINGQRELKKQVIEPKKKWTIFLVPHIHLDIGYSDYQAKVAAIQSRAIDEAMSFSERNSSFSFSVDGSWSLEQFLRSRSPSEQQQVVKSIRTKHVFVPAQYANLLTGFSTAETLIRSLYFSANFSRVHGTAFNYANITDVPSYSWAYPSILAAAGIHDFLAGANSRNVRAPVLMQGHLNQSSPMWWKGPDGAKVLFWYSRGYQQMRGLFSDPPVVTAGAETLPLFLQQYEGPNYLANSVIIYGTQQENTDLFPQQAKIAQEWNSQYAYPRIAYSGFHHALEAIANQFGNNLPTISGDGGPYWEDGIAADALYAAIERGNEVRAPSAEKLQTISSLIDTRLAPDKEMLAKLWTNILLVDEHTWTSSDSVRDPESAESTEQTKLKESFATEAQQQADWLARSSMASIADSIPVKPGSVVVFNTLNWKRSGEVTLDVPKGSRVIDPSTGKVLPSELVNNENAIARMRVIIPDVPAIGFKVVTVQRGKNIPEPYGPDHSTVLENTFYRIQLDPATGSIRSIIDKQLGREIVSQKSPYRFGQYLYVTGGDQEPNSLLQYRPAWPKPNLTVHPSEDGHLETITHTEDVSVALMRSAGMNTPAIETEVRLYNHEKKIELLENIDKTQVESKEGVYFAFPFALDHPEFKYEIQNGVVDPEKDMYPGAGHEWFSVQHWASVEQGGLAAAVMPLDAPLMTFGDINRGQWPTEFGKRTGTLFSYAMNNYWHTNFRAGQGGHFRFRYVITSAAAFDEATLSRMGWQESTPLEINQVTTQDKAQPEPGTLSDTQQSFVDIQDENLLLETWKPAEDGNGTILRFLDLGGPDRTAVVRIPLLDLSEAWITDAVERNQERITPQGHHQIQFPIHSHGIVTVRVIGQNALRVSANE